MYLRKILDRKQTEQQWLEEDIRRLLQKLLPLQKQADLELRYPLFEARMTIQAIRVLFLIHLEAVGIVHGIFRRLGGSCRTLIQTLFPDL